MKIAYLMQSSVNLIQPPFDGPAEHIRSIIRALQDLGHEVSILFTYNRQTYFSRDMQTFEALDPVLLDRNIPRLFEKIIRKTQSMLRLPFFAWFDSLRFARAAEYYLADADVYLERISWMGYGGTLLAKKLRKPLVLEFNGDPLHDLRAKNQAPGGVQLDIAKNRYRFTLQAADAVIASGQGWRQNLIETWHVPTTKIHVIENGTPLVDLLAREELKSFSADGRNSKALKVVYLGGFYPWHGTEILMEAFQCCLEENPALELLLVGSGSGYEETRETVNRKSLSAKIELTGRLTPQQYAPLLAQADIAVSPYCGWQEYSGLKLFDYKAAGLAIIASGENGQPATIQNGVTGLIIPPCDQAELTRSLKTLINDPRLRLQLGQNARLEAESIHSWKHSAHKVSAVLENTLHVHRN